MTSNQPPQPSRVCIHVSMYVIMHVIKGISVDLHLYVLYCLVLYCIVLYLYIYIALHAVHTNQKRFQCERPREKRAVLRERKEALGSPVNKVDLCIFLRVRVCMEIFHITLDKIVTGVTVESHCIKVGQRRIKECQTERQTDGRTEFMHG